MLFVGLKGHANGILTGAGILGSNVYGFCGAGRFSAVIDAVFHITANFSIVFARFFLHFSNHLS